MTATNELPILPTEEPQDTPQSPEAVFTIWGTAVRVKPAFLVNLAGLWGLLAWLAGRGHPERPWPLRLLIGLLSTTAMMVADLGHAMAHTISARYAGAPMDEILDFGGHAAHPVLRQRRAAARAPPARPGWTDLQYRGIGH